MSPRRALTEPPLVCHVSEIFAPRLGGVETALQTILSELTEIPHLVLTNPYPGVPPTTWPFPHVRVERIPPSDDLVRRALQWTPVRARPPAKLVATLATFIGRERRRRLRVRRTHAVRLVHIHSFALWRRFVAVAKKRPGLPMAKILRWLTDFEAYGRPVLFTDHSLFGGPNDQFIATGGPQLVRGLARVVCVEESGVRNVRQWAADEGLSLQVSRVPNPVDTHLFHPRPMPPLGRLALGYVGRAGKEGLDVIWDLARNAPQWLKMHIVLALEPGERPPDVPSGVAVAYNVPNSELPSFYGSVHVMIDPYSFGLPRTTLEALACGRPVLRIRREDSDPLPPNLSPTISSRDPADIAEALARWRDTPEALSESAAAARRYAEDIFSSAKVVNAYRRIYREIAG